MTAQIGEQRRELKWLEEGGGDDADGADGGIVISSLAASAALPKSWLYACCNAGGDLPQSKVMPAAMNGSSPAKGRKERLMRRFLYVIGRGGGPEHVFAAAQSALRDPRWLTAEMGLSVVELVVQAFDHHWNVAIW